MEGPSLIDSSKNKIINSCKIITNIDNTYLKQLLARDTTVIDVRIPYEWKETGIIKGSLPILFFDEKGRPQADSWIKTASQHINPENELVLVCRTGRRSRVVAEYLAIHHGYHKLYNHEGGIKHWLAEGNETLRWDQKAA